jgi:hypothetical protein
MRKLSSIIASVLAAMPTPPACAESLTYYATAQSHQGATFRLVIHRMETGFGSTSRLQPVRPVSMGRQFAIPLKWMRPAISKAGAAGFRRRTPGSHWKGI